MRSIARILLLSLSLVGTAMAADDASFKLPASATSQHGIDWTHADQPGGGKGMCYANCDSAQGICIGNCSGNATCISNCDSAHGTCIANCSFEN